MSYTDLRFAGFNRAAWDPSWSPNFVSSGNPETPIGTLQQGPFAEGLSHFTPNALGQKALDTIKAKTGINLNVQYQPSSTEGTLGFYAGKQPGESPNTRTVNFTTFSPTLEVLLHEAGHAEDPLQNQKHPIVPSEFRNLSAPAERLNYIWNHDAALPQNPWLPPTNTGFSAVKAETEAQRFAKEYLGNISPTTSTTFTGNPWFKGYPQSYGDQTIQAVYNAELQPTSPTYQSQPGSDTQFENGSVIAQPSNAYNALKMSLDPKFQKIQSGILTQSQDYVNNILR